jgi:sortase (surface protein transpeptidase)
VPSPADRPRPDRRRSGRRSAATALAVAVLAVVGGCVGGDAPGATTLASDAGTLASAPSPAPTGTPPPAAPVPDVPLHGTTLADVAAAAAVPPVSLAVPALDLTVPVDPVGVETDGQMEIPPLAERAGWYRYGASPGDADGTAVIAAHVDSVASAGLGPFARLPDAAVGDAVEVTLADGSVRRYAVTAVERLAKPTVAWPDVFVRDGGARLVLVTCGGTFQRDVGRYTDNVLVTAEPVGAG